LISRKVPAGHKRDSAARGIGGLRLVQRKHGNEAQTHLKCMYLKGGNGRGGARKGQGSRPLGQPKGLKGEKNRLEQEKEVNGGSESPGIRLTRVIWGNGKET